MNQEGSRGCNARRTMDYLVSKDVAASDGLKVSRMYVKSFGYGTSTVVDTKMATDTFAVAWGVNIYTTRQMGRNCDIQSSRTNSHPKLSQSVS